jgi:N-acetylglucosaminyldiphosphoundecaprenol N-acetyl-beta-D-mannosaminyltransferase
LGIPLSERVAGSDLFDQLSQQKNRDKKISVFFFGGDDGVAELASQKLNELSTGMSCCGTYGPGFVSIDEMSTPDIIECINKADPDFLLIAVGAEKGQSWIQKNRQKLNVPVLSNLGATINFVAGRVIRSPIIWRRAGLEWVWRIKQEPALWKRYLFDGLAFIKLFTFNVLPLVVYDRWLQRSADFLSPVGIDRQSVEKGLIKLSGSIHCTVLEPIKHCFDEILQGDNGDVSLDCSALVHIDSAFIGTLLLYQGYLNEQDRQLCLQNVSKRVVRIIKMNNALKHFNIKIALS